MNLVTQFLRGRASIDGKSTLAANEMEWLVSGLTAHMHDPTDPESPTGDFAKFQMAMEKTLNSLYEGIAKKEDKENFNIAIWYVGDVFSNEDGVKKIVASMKSKLEDETLFGKLSADTLSAAKKAVSSFRKSFGRNLILSDEEIKMLSDEISTISKEDADYERLQDIDEKLLKQLEDGNDEHLIALYSFEKEALKSFINKNKNLKSLQDRL